jgi:signal transduction histidine kinase
LLGQLLSMSDTAHKLAAESQGLGSQPDIKSLIHQLADHSGAEYFQKLAHLLCDTFGLDSACVGLLDDTGTQMTTVGIVWDGETVEAISYPVAGTPCYVTINEDFCFYPSGVAEAFPDDQMLSDEKIEGYIGVSIRDKRGKAIGSITGLSHSELQADTNLVDLTKVVAARTRAELQHYALEEKLKETLSEALLLNYSKSMFMANISHELRNPLSAIIGYASLIRDRQVDGPNINEYANEICLAGEDLLTLINDILSLSSLELSGEAVDRSEFDLTDIARTGRRLQQEQAAAKNLTLMPVINTEPLYITGDATHTKKALLNILSNAVKYTSMGDIEITTSLNDNGEAILAVRDTGVGMDAMQVEEASKGLSGFERAYNMHQDGGGLGLPLTCLLIERQGGRMEIDSKKGAGTTVRLIFPADCVTGEKGDFI